MLTIKIPASDFYDETRGIFVETKERVLQLEHSLVSISKWESKWHKPFLSETQKTDEEALDYIRCMTITQNVDPNVYYAIDEKTAKTINDYMDNTMTATVIYDAVTGAKVQPKKRTITSELVYSWMIANDIPIKFEKWHFNRLMTLIRVCSIENGQGNKMTQKELNKSNWALNEARRKKLGTRG